jgi:hypothetical protein
VNKIIKPIAFYLPQFHPIPENDEWWGKGFTEWTNVTKATSLFDGHYQPRLPADLGFYDLRVAEIRNEQAQLAKKYGIFGFCYWHYWFAGKRILERPFTEVVQSGQPDFPFCLAWANQTWEGTWHGLSNDKILIEQTYPGIEDYKSHFYALLSSFKDPRYIEVNGKKIFFIFKPLDMPNSIEFTECWQKLAIKEGITGFHFVGMHMSEVKNSKDYGCDAFVQDLRPWGELKDLAANRYESYFSLPFFNKKKKVESPRLFSYHDFVDLNSQKSVEDNEYPLIYCDWDNTARCGTQGWLFKDFNIDSFSKDCDRVFQKASIKSKENESIVIVKSWNEWAEGNYMEPDQKYGYSLLNAFHESLQKLKI